jgi:hypothetical protein
MLECGVRFEAVHISDHHLRAATPVLRMTGINRSPRTGQQTQPENTSDGFAEQKSDKKPGEQQ